MNHGLLSLLFGYVLLFGARHVASLSSLGGRRAGGGGVSTTTTTTTTFFDEVAVHDVDIVHDDDDVVRAFSAVVDRRTWTTVAAVMTCGGVGWYAARPSSASAAETIGKDADCNDADCLGVWDGLLADCPHGNNVVGVATRLDGGARCTASQDDTPGIFSEPWDYSDDVDASDWELQARRLLPAIELVSNRRGDRVDVVLRRGRYLRVDFTDGRTGERSVGEFYFTPDDATVQFRVGAATTTTTTSSSPLSWRNADRCEAIRKQLGWLKLPVLRNRRRSLFFGESEFDTFGPGSASLGEVGGERVRELDPERDSRLDAVQNFPSTDGSGGRNARRGS